MSSYASDQYGAFASHPARAGRAGESLDVTHGRRTRPRAAPNVPASAGLSAPAVGEVWSVISTDARIRTRGADGRYALTRQRVPHLHRVRVLEVDGDRARVGSEDGTRTWGWTAAANLVQLFKDRPALQRVALAPANAIPLSGLRGRQHAIAETWNRLGGLLDQVATAMRLPVAVALGIWHQESGGRAQQAGQAILRFENHVFFRRWGRRHTAAYDAQFQHGGRSPHAGKQAHLSHHYRVGTTGAWTLLHPAGESHQEVQRRQYEARDLAARLADQETALLCVSFGGPQIMGFNHRTCGYATATAMHAAFQGGERAQVLGFADFMSWRGSDRTRGYMLGHAGAGRWRDLGAAYNGAASYGDRLRDAVADAEHVLRALSAQGQGRYGIPLGLFTHGARIAGTTVRPIDAADASAATPIDAPVQVQGRPRPPVPNVDPEMLTAFFSQYEDDSDVPAAATHAYLTEPALLRMGQQLRDRVLQRWSSGNAPLTQTQLVDEANAIAGHAGTALLLCHNVTKAFSRGGRAIRWQKTDRARGIYSDGSRSWTARVIHADGDLHVAGQTQPSIFYLLFHEDVFGRKDPGDWYHFFLMATCAWYGATSAVTGSGLSHGEALSRQRRTFYSSRVYGLVQSLIRRTRVASARDTMAYKGWRWGNALSFLEGAHYGASQTEVDDESRVHLGGANLGLTQHSQAAGSDWHWFVPRAGHLTQWAAIFGFDLDDATYQRLSPTGTVVSSARPGSGGGRARSLTEDADSPERHAPPAETSNPTADA